MVGSFHCTSHMGSFSNAGNEAVALIIFHNLRVDNYLTRAVSSFNASLKRRLPPPDVAGWSFNWPQLWLNSCPLLCHISLIYSVWDRARDWVPDCLHFPQRLIVVEQYVARQHRKWLAQPSRGLHFPSLLMLDVLVGVKLWARFILFIFFNLHQIIRALELVSVKMHIQAY